MVLTDSRGLRCGVLMAFKGSVGALILILEGGVRFIEMERNFSSMYSQHNSRRDLTLMTIQLRQCDYE